MVKFVFYTWGLANIVQAILIAIYLGKPGEETLLHFVLSGFSPFLMLILISLISLALGFLALRFILNLRLKPIRGFAILLLVEPLVIIVNLFVVLAAYDGVEYFPESLSLTTFGIIATFFVTVLRYKYFIKLNNNLRANESEEKRIKTGKLRPEEN